MDMSWLSSACAELRTRLQRARGLWPPSNRYGREIGFIMTAFLAALAMGPISPLLPVAAAAYFALMWLFWRYQARPTRASITPAS